MRICALGRRLVGPQIGCLLHDVGHLLGMRTGDELEVLQKQGKIAEETEEDREKRKMGVFLAPKWAY